MKKKKITSKDIEINCEKIIGEENKQRSEKSGKKNNKKKEKNENE